MFCSTVAVIFIVHVMILVCNCSTVKKNIPFFAYFLGVSSLQMQNMLHTIVMKTKTEASPEEFWNRVDFIVRQRRLKFTEICRDQEVAYKTLMSNRSRQEYPGLENSCKLASSLDVTTDFLVYGKQDVKEKAPDYGASDKLYALLEEECDLKALIWRVVQCSAIQLRTIKTLLSSWGIGIYDASGNSKAMASS